MEFFEPFRGPQSVNLALANQFDARMQFVAISALCSRKTTIQLQFDLA